MDRFSDIFIVVSFVPPCVQTARQSGDRGKQPFLQVSYNAKFVTGNQNRRVSQKFEESPQVG